ncbi:hypothetical protein AB3S75_032592 [Citrus x aurantiifolia]
MKQKIPTGATCNIQFVHAMEPRKISIRFFVLVAYVFISATNFFTLTDARHVVQFSSFQGPAFSRNSIHKPMKKPKLSSRVNIHKKFYLSRAESNGLSAPFSFPPLESIAPLSSPHNNIPAPFCIYPPSTPNLPFQSPPSAAVSPPGVSPGLSPPSTGVPAVSPGLSPPSTGTRTPPPYGPSPPKLAPGSPVYQPPMAHPPPAGPPPPPHQNPRFPVWCVAKPTVPDSIIQEAMDYACGTGADCKPIQTNGSCFQPNTLVAHASYAFNSYWQKTKNRGGTCDFGGIAMLVTTDPSFSDCNFISN